MAPRKTAADNAAAAAQDGSSIATVILNKESKDITVGLTFGEREDKKPREKKEKNAKAAEDDNADNGNNKVVIISDIDKSGLANQTELHKGMELLRLNGVTNIPSCEAANQIIANATGTIGIVAKHPLGFVPECICRSDPSSQRNEPLGISLGGAKEQKGKKIVVITEIKEGSLAAQSKLQEGMIIRAVNHKKVADMSPKEVYKLIYNCTDTGGTVKFLTQPSNPYSRRAKTEIFDTYKKPAPDSVPSSENVGYWASVDHCRCKDIAILPCVFVFASFGLIFTNRKHGKRSIYILDGQAYNKQGKRMGDESDFVKE